MMNTENDLVMKREAAERKCTDWPGSMTFWI